jgi:hypothetical protein
VAVSWRVRATFTAPTLTDPTLTDPAQVSVLT